MQNKLTDFLSSLSPLFFGLLFCFAAYKVATDSIQTNLYIIGFLCVLLGLFFGGFLRMARIIKKKDKEIEILKYEVYDDPGIKRIKKLAIDTLQEEQNEERKKENKIKNLAWAIALTILPAFIYPLTFKLQDKYFDVFSGRFMYVSQDYYFEFSLISLLDSFFFLVLVLWAGAIWFCLKVRKEIPSRKSSLNYLVLVLIVLNSVGLLYSLWFLVSFFLS